MFGLRRFILRPTREEPAPPAIPIEPVQDPPAMPRTPAPYEVPDPSGKCWLLELPEELLQSVFLRLDLPDLTRCFRLCKSIHELTAHSTAIKLQHTLMANSLRVNPHAMAANPDVPEQMPQSTTDMLATLRERLTRFRNLKPASESSVQFLETGGSLYEYLDGVLLRTTTRAKGPHLAVYDLRKADDWENTGETIDDDDEVINQNTIENDVRSTHRFDFDIHELAVDPGQDLLVLVTVQAAPERPARRVSVSGNLMKIHLFSLSTFEPHPRAKQPVLQWPNQLALRSIHLDFQICDDGLYILSTEMSTQDRHVPDELYGWQWTTGHLHVNLKATVSATFHSFVLLTPWSLVVPTSVARIHHDSETEADLENLADLYWTFHLQLYAFPPFPTTDESTTPHGATHVATVDLLPLRTSIEEGLWPMVMTIRTDPPPRHTAPTHPLHAPPPFVCDPESGVAIIEFYFNQHVPHPNISDATRFTLVVPKTVLLKYLPEPTSPLLLKSFARPVPVIPWETITPDVRLFGPPRLPAYWVCYVYQNRYVTSYIDPAVLAVFEQEGGDLRVHLKRQLFDFDQMRVRKERALRAAQHPFSDPSDEDLEGDIDGIELVLSETMSPKVGALIPEQRTGSRMGYIMVKKPTDSITQLIDSERLLTVHTRRQTIVTDDSDSDEEEAGLHIHEF